MRLWRTSSYQQRKAFRSVLVARQLCKVHAPWAIRSAGLTVCPTPKRALKAFPRARLPKRRSKGAWTPQNEKRKRLDETAGSDDAGLRRAWHRTVCREATCQTAMRRTDARSAARPHHHVLHRRYALHRSRSPRPNAALSPHALHRPAHRKTGSATGTGLSASYWRGLGILRCQGSRSSSAGCAHHARSLSHALRATGARTPTGFDPQRFCMQKARLRNGNRAFSFILAESWGFEPQIPFAGYTRLAGEHLRPLGQLSGTVLLMIAHRQA